MRETLPLLTRTLELEFGHKRPPGAGHEPEPSHSDSNWLFMHMGTRRVSFGRSCTPFQTYSLLLSEDVTLPRPFLFPLQT